jgi:hypothetical protein
MARQALLSNIIYSVVIMHLKNQISAGPKKENGLYLISPGVQHYLTSSGEGSSLDYAVF